MLVKLSLVKPSTFMAQAEFMTLEDITVSGHTIPRGTITDGATQPRWLIFLALVLLWTDFFVVGWISLLMAYLIPAFGNYVLAVILHDKLLQDGLDRKDADRAMKEALEFLGVKTVWQVVMYRLVRLNSQLLRWNIG